MNSKKRILKYSLAITTLIMMLILMSGCFEKKKEEQSTYKTAINYYFEGAEKGSFEIYKKAYPDFLIDDLKVNEGNLKESLSKMKNTYGDDVKITYEVSSEKDLTNSDVSIVENYIKMKYDKNVDIGEAKQVEIRETIKGYKKEDTPKVTLRIYKIDGEWKIITESISSMKTKLERNK